MEDTNTSVIPWLLFSLALPGSTRLADQLRQHTRDPAEIRELLERCCTRKSASLPLNLPDSLCQQLSVEALQPLFSDATTRRLDQALEWESQSCDHHLISLDHPAYPPLLRETDFAPLLLYAKGDIDALRHPPMAVVGSRKASHQALSHTRSICQSLANEGYCIVSGLALGVDAAAHEGALSGKGITIAVAATEPDKVYPRRHEMLARRIVDAGGLILTEHPIGTATRPFHFPQRNRIISGMSLGVLVAEAALPSGTMTTALHALNQGRDVMAVPGSVHNLHARGCHSLIKQGAALVEDVADIRDVLQGPLARLQAHFPAHGKQDNSLQSTPQDSSQQQLDLEHPDLSPIERSVLHSLSIHPASVDELLTQSSFDVSQLSSSLGLLEIRGMITLTGSGRYARC